MIQAFKTSGSASQWQEAASSEYPCFQSPPYTTNNLSLHVTAAQSAPLETMEHGARKR
ncbi:hypothetical protein V2A60_001026 [Cordyceps javanica]